jgi:hypothetical protein
VLGTPVVLTPPDAVAVIVQLAQSPQTGRPLAVRLDASHVWLERAGTVTLSPGLLPPLGDVAALLDQLLRRGQGAAPERIPRGLRAIVERASSHDGTSIPSLSAFAAALTPFQAPDPAAAIRLLIAAADEWTSAVPATQPAALPVPVPAPAAPLPVTPPPPDPIADEPPTYRSARARLAATIAAALVAAAIGGTIARLRHTEPTVPPAPAAPSIDSKPVAAVAPAPPTPVPPSLASAPAPVPVALTPARLVDRREADAEAVFSPSFAGSGTAVFFHAESSGGSALKRADAGSGELRVATIVDDGARNYHVRLSPDGTSVAFDSDRDGVRGVYVADAEGRNVRRVSGPGHAAVPTWSPDGRQLAFIRAEPDRPSVWNLWLLDRDTGRQLRVTSFPRGQVWSGAWFADGQRLAYSHDDRLLIHDLATGRARNIASPIPGRQVRTPAVSPDGRWIVFQVFRDGAWLFDVESGAMQRVLEDASAEEFAWSPDGRRVAYHSRRSGGWNLWTMAAP